MEMQTIKRSTWESQYLDYAAYINRWTDPFRERRRIGKAHPIHDFLFVYYQYSPAKLERWFPGVGLNLESNSDQSNRFPESSHSFDGVRVWCDSNKLDSKSRQRLKWIVNLLQSTEQHRPNFSCLGLHEWAMVYRGQEIRHEKTTKLRLPQSEIDQIVESRTITCSHFDAFRFFAKDAMPLNRLQPTLDSQPEMEQPACIHANMDLYKWAFKSMPWVGSQLLQECFELALEARAIDMRASPYDLSDFSDCEPILIETADGRLEYERWQRDIAAQAKPVRAKLKIKLESILKEVAERL